MRKMSETAIKARQERIDKANANQARLDRMYIEEGFDVMHLIWSCPCEICSKYQNRLFSLTGKTKGLPTKQELVDAGVFHKDCIHSYTAVSEWQIETEYDENGYPLPKEVSERLKAKQSEEDLAWLREFARKHNI